MSMHFKLELPTACDYNGPIFAVPHVLKSRSDVSPLKKIYLGTSTPGYQNDKDLVSKVVSGMRGTATPPRLQEGLMAIEVYKLCDKDHESTSKKPKIVEPRLERVVAVALAATGVIPFKVRAIKHQGDVKLYHDPILEGAGPFFPVVFLSATRAEVDERRISQAIQSVPFGKNNERGFVALRGFETIIHPSELL